MRRRWRRASWAVSCAGGLMMGVGVLAAFSWTSRGVPAADRSDCGVVGLSGEMERARSASEDISCRLCGSRQRAGRTRHVHTCSAR
jgi:hypothetical protein